MKIHNISPQIKNSQNSNNKPVSFSRNTSSWATNFFKLERKGNMTRDLFNLNAFAFLLGGRLLKSRDTNEIRETITRDVPTILLAVYGVPVIGEIIAKGVQTKSGFAIGTKISADKKSELLKNKRIKLLSREQVKDWYVLDSNLHGGFDNFTKRLDEQGGNLKKIFSELGEDIKGKLTDYSENNTEFKNKLNKNPELKNQIETLFKNPQGNKAFERAKFLKAVPKIFGIALTLVSIGILIPEINIHLTRIINKNKARKEQGINKTA